MPHSEILGSKPARGSPRLVAACHVLHRLLAPRHPPDALAFLDPPQRQPHRPQPQARARNVEKAAAARMDGSSNNFALQKTLTPGTDARASIPMPFDAPAHRRKKRGRTRRLPAPVHATMHTGSRENLHARGRALSPPYDVQRTRSLQTGRARHRIDAAARAAGEGLPFRDGRARTQATRAGTPKDASLVGLGRLERPTSRLSGVRSNQLSYRPESHPKDRTRRPHPHGRKASRSRQDCLAATPAGAIMVVRRDVQTAVGL